MEAGDFIDLSGPKVWAAANVTGKSANRPYQRLTAKHRTAVPLFEGHPQSAYFP